MKWVYNDGGRANAGYRGNTGDCVVRAITISSGKPYQEVYNRLNSIAGSMRQTKRVRGSNSRTGVFRIVYERYLKELGYIWIPLMSIGSGCKYHLIDSEIPSGNIIVRLSRHLACVIDRVIYDTHDPQKHTLIVENGVKRFTGRCVYGYWTREMSAQSVGER